ncbi:MAG: SET domain-containing protein-lysine N-methyltransferase [Chitinophagaceae bacterium]|nr:SET domain-containing protein-lysine N-methyltransferase [Chitinophagaceae bacterium]
MALLEKDLVIKRSSIPDSGKGLFTTVFIPEGTRIVEYKGKISSWKEVDHDNGKNGYIYYVTRNYVIDASSYPKALARYANDARGLQRVNGINNNCVYIQENKRVYIESTKNIAINSEILVEYGKEYWDVIRYNARLEAKENKQSKEKLLKKRANK